MSEDNESNFGSSAVITASIGLLGLVYPVLAILRNYLNLTGDSFSLTITPLVFGVLSVLAALCIGVLHKIAPDRISSDLQNFSWMLVVFYIYNLILTAVLGAVALVS